MVGVARPGRRAAVVTETPAPFDPARQAYRGAADRWDRDVSAAYAPMAVHLISQSPVDLDGALVLDAGAGTGVASAALLAANARVIAVDVESSMLAFDRAQRPPGAVASVTSLPLVTGAFDVVVAAFVVNHVVEVADALRELARVTKHGGAVLASTFSNRRASAKSAFDEVATAYGWSAPTWYDAIKDRQSAIGTTARLRAAAQRARLDDVVITQQELDIRVDDPDTIVRYRLGMPQYASFLDHLDEERLGELVREATTAVSAEGAFRPEVIELVARIT